MKTQRNTLTRIARQLAGILSVGLALLLVNPAMMMAQSLTAVNLGAAGDFAILAGSLVSNVPTSAVTGNIGLSPASGANITGFGGAEVTGVIYTVDATGPAGSVESATMLLAAKGDITTAYNDAAGRTPVPEGPFLNPGSGDIGGMTIVPGLYKFTSSLSITGSDVTLSGSDTDVWIFQIASELLVGEGIQVILAGGALPANIFWQVGTSATLGTTCIFQGNIIADQSVSLGTGATLNGRALANSGAVTIESSTVTRPGLVTAVENNDIVPTAYNLSQNYPNPFNPTTMINYEIPTGNHVTLTVFDVLGREVSVLVNEMQNAGSHKISWDAKGFPSGLYIYQLKAGSFVSMKQMLFLK